MVYSILYFPLQGRAQLLKYICEEGQIAYETQIYDFAEFAKIKATLPFGQFPVLREKDSDFELAQTVAIARFLAAEGNLLPKSTDHRANAQVDMLLVALNDIRVKYYDCAFHGKSVADYEKVLHAHLVKFESLLQKNGGKFFAGDALTVADLALFDFILENAQLLENMSVETYPGLVALKDSVQARPNIAQLLEKGDGSHPIRFPQQ